MKFADTMETTIRSHQYSTINAVVLIKTKRRNRLAVDSDLMIGMAIPFYQFFSKKTFKFFEICLLESN